MANCVLLKAHFLRNSLHCSLRRTVSLLSTARKDSKNETDKQLTVKGKEEWIPVEKETHTGQKWDDDDYRLVRFIGKEKQINERFAIDLIAETPPIACKDRVVSCDGGDGPLGHPRVFINLDIPGNHSCGYCGLRFFLEHDSHH